MRGSRVAKRYARALLALAGHGQAEAWGVELEKLARTVDTLELMTRLTAPEISHDQQQQAMAKIAEILGLSFPLRSFAVVIARHGRVPEIGAIALAYRDLLDDLLGQQRATLSFATQPGDADVRRVVAGLEAIAGKKIIATIKVDAALLGGMIAELGGKIYDGSLATSLAEAQRRLAG